MKQSKTLIKWLTLLLVLSLTLFLILRNFYCDSNALVIIFRTFFTGSVVGLITAIITYFSTKSRVIQDFSNDLLRSHTELFNVKNILNDAANRIKNRGMFFDTQELSIWMQTINSIATHTHNTLIVPYKFSPIIKGYKNCRIKELMSQYIKADRDFWNDVDRARYQIMTAKIALEDNYKLRKITEFTDDQYKQQVDEEMFRNDRDVSGLVRLLENAATSGDRLKESALSFNAWLDAKTSVSPLLEIDESERENYAKLVNEAKNRFSNDKSLWKKRRKEEKVAKKRKSKKSNKQ